MNITRSNTVEFERGMLRTKAMERLSGDLFGGMPPMPSAAEDSSKPGGMYL